MCSPHSIPFTLRRCARRRQRNSLHSIALQRNYQSISNLIQLMIGLDLFVNYKTDERRRKVQAARPFGFFRSMCAILRPANAPDFSVPTSYGIIYESINLKIACAMRCACFNPFILHFIDLNCFKSASFALIELIYMQNCCAYESGECVKLPFVSSSAFPNCSKCLCLLKRFPFHKMTRTKARLRNIRPAGDRFVILIVLTWPFLSISLLVNLTFSNETTCFRSTSTLIGLSG